jgi:hypothetical protein
LQKKSGLAVSAHSADAAMAPSADSADGEISPSAHSADAAMAPSADSADGEISPSAHSAVSVDGVRLTELIAALPLSRGSIFEIIKALGIVTTKGPGAGGKGRVAWVSNADGERLFDAAHRVNRGEVRIADLAGVLTPQTRQTPPLTPCRSCVVCVKARSSRTRRS